MAFKPRSTSRRSTVAFLLSRGAGVNLFDEDISGPSQALHHAAEASNPGTVKLLLDNGAEKHRQGRMEETALSLAMFHPGRRGATPRQKETVELLVKHGLNIDKSGVLYRAIGSRDQSLIKYLFDNGGTVNNHGSDEMCILAKAAGTDVQTVQFLFENGAVLCKPGNRCEPNALSEAARKGNIDILQLLLPYAHDEIVSESTEALTVAAFAGHVESVKILLRAGMDLESRDQYNRTALHAACLPYHTTLPDMVEFLISQGARIDACDFRGDTPLHIHLDAYIQDPAVTKHLLEAGSDITARNINGNTPLLMLAAKMHCPNNTHARAPHTIKSSSIEVLKMILATGSDVVVQNNERHTALHCLVLSRLIRSTGECAVEAATLLFQGGVDVKAVDAAGRTVLDILRGKSSTSRQHRLLLATITDFLQERSRPRITVSNDDM